MAKSKIDNRETWLVRAAEAMEPTLFRPAKISLPEFAVSVGFPLGRRVVKKKGQSGVIGQCFDASQSADKKAHVFISPVLDAPLEVVATLAHEMIHVAMPKAGHGRAFADAARAIKLDGKPTATVAGEDFSEAVRGILDKLGPYPHAALEPSEDRKKQGTRLVKCECPKHGYIVRTTRKWIDEMGVPKCPCGRVMVTEDGDDGE